MAVSYTLSYNGRTLSLATPRIMGILNVTPDSFSDGGLWNDPDRAFAHALKMLGEGADIIDIGGESTRPGAREVSEQEELDRVIPAVEKIWRETGCWISVDTSRPEVIREAVKAGASVWNDIRALGLEGAVSAAAALDVPVILMHMQGKPRTMQQAPHYDDVVSEVKEFLLSRATCCLDAGVRRERIMLDPGFGFGKSAEDNYTLLGHLEELCALGYPLLSALSRKSMLGAATGVKDPKERVSASVAGHLISVMKGACMVRAHDVAATKQALDVYAAMRQACKD